MDWTLWADEKIKALENKISILENKIEHFYSLHPRMQILDNFIKTLSEVPDSPSYNKEILNNRLWDYEFDKRTETCFSNENIKYVGELVRLSDADLLRIPNFGRKSLNDVKRVLSTIGFTLNTDVGDWVAPHG